VRGAWQHVRSWLSDNSGLRQRWLYSIGLAAVVGVVYFLAARLSLFLLSRPDGVAVFWPAAGVSSGTLIALGRNARWPVAIGIIPATIAANLTSDRAIWASSIFALSNVVEAQLTAWVIERYVGAAFSLDRLRHVLWLLAAAIIGTSASGVVATAGYKLFHSPAVPAIITWWHWFCSDAIGIITTAPVILGIASVVRAPPPRRELIEGTAALIAIAAVMGVIIFLLPQDWWDRIAPVELLLPLLLWISARCGPAFTSAAVFVVSLTIVGAFIFRLGHFGDIVPSTEQRILAIQSAVLGVAIFSYILAALFAERRLAEEHQKTLTRELQHRTNNLLAVVQTIANRTLSGDYPLKEANEILEARLQALARANKQLTESDWSGLTLKEIIRSELEPYLARCEIEGTDIALDRQYAQNFSLVLHELATNAVKYGALSNLEGRVHITWGIRGGGRDAQLIFQWRERGGPPVVAPKRQGFGSTLLRATFANACSNFDTNGFSCEIEVPFREVARPVDARPEPHLVRENASERRPQN
jgi:two-component sensor histidine kinase